MFAITLLACGALIVGWTDRVCVTASTPARQCFRITDCCGAPIGCPKSDPPQVSCLFFPRPLIRRWAAVERFEHRDVQPLFAASVATLVDAGHPDVPIAGAIEREPLRVAETLFSLSCLLLE